MKKTNLLLLGFRGAGKSYFSKEVSKQLGLKLFSCDEEIQKRVGLSIADYVDLKGWNAFREIEKKVLRENFDLSHTLIDIGGGAVVYTEIMNEFKKNSVFCYIKVDPDVIVKRLELDPSRPRLSDEGTLKEEIKRTLAKRRPLYERYADITIENNGDISTAPEKLLELVSEFKKLL